MVEVVSPGITVTLPTLFYFLDFEGRCVVDVTQIHILLGNSIDGRLSQRQTPTPAEEEEILVCAESTCWSQTGSKANIPLTFHSHFLSFCPITWVIRILGKNSWDFFEISLIRYSWYTQPSMRHWDLEMESCPSKKVRCVNELLYGRRRRISQLHTELGPHWGSSSAIKNFNRGGVFFVFEENLMMMIFFLSEEIKKYIF